MTDTTPEAVERLIDRIHESKAGRDVRTDAIATLRALSAEVARLKAPAPTEDEATKFDRADWYWRTMDPDDCGDTPMDAINGAMVGNFCVCEIASSFTGPIRYGFIAPILVPDSDDYEFLHFSTQQEAIDAAKVRADLARQGGAE